MSITGFNLRRRLEKAKSEEKPVISTVTETVKTKVEEVKTETTAEVEKTVTEKKPVHKKTVKK